MGPHEASDATANAAAKRGRRRPSRPGRRHTHTPIAIGANPHASAVTTRRGSDGASLPAAAATPETIPPTATNPALTANHMPATNVTMIQAKRFIVMVTTLRVLTI